MSNVYRIFDYKPAPKPTDPVVESIKSNLDELQQLFQKLKLTIRELEDSIYRSSW